MRAQVPYLITSEKIELLPNTREILQNHRLPPSLTSIPTLLSHTKYSLDSISACIFCLLSFITSLSTLISIAHAWHWRRLLRILRRRRRLLRILRRRHELRLRLRLRLVRRCPDRLGPLGFGPLGLGPLRLGPLRLNPLIVILARLGLARLGADAGCSPPFPSLFPVPASTSALQVTLFPASTSTLQVTYE